jgi:hypothetical protein
MRYYKTTVEERSAVSIIPKDMKMKHTKWLHWKFGTTCRWLKKKILLLTIPFGIHSDILFVLKYEIKCSFKEHFDWSNRNKIEKLFCFFLTRDYFIENLIIKYRFSLILNIKVY